MWCDIHYQTTPIVPPKSCPHGISAIVPAKHVCNIAALQKPLFPLILLHSSKHQYLQQFSWSDYTSFLETVKHVSKKCITCKWLCFHSVLLHCQSSNQYFIAVNAIVHLAVYITCWDGFQWDHMRVEKRLVIPPWTCIFPEILYETCFIVYPALKHASFHIHTAMTSARKLHVALMLLT